MARQPRPWEDPDAPTIASITYDSRPSWERSDPAQGVSAMHALYHFVDPTRAAVFLELDELGYGDESNIDPLWWPDELREFRLKAFRWRSLKVELVGGLYRKLRKGELIARGFSNQMPLDAPRRPVNPERWVDLQLDLKASAATGPEIAITRILIFAASGTQADDPARPATFSAAALRKWYLDRIAACEAQGRKPSRDDDYRDANATFGRVPKREVEAARRELAPEAWRRKGRRSRA